MRKRINATRITASSMAVTRFDQKACTRRVPTALVPGWQRLCSVGCGLPGRLTTRVCDQSVGRLIPAVPSADGSTPGTIGPSDGPGGISGGIAINLPLIAASDATCAYCLLDPTTVNAGAPLCSAVI